MMANDTLATILTALAGVIGGGFGVEVLRRVFVSPDRKLDDAAAIRREMATLMDAEQVRARVDREELRAELKSERGRIDLMEQEIQTWRKRCFELEEELARTKAELVQVRRQIGEEPK